MKNHQFTLALYRKHAQRELRKPADTRFCSQYLMLDSIRENMAHLRAVVTTDEWATWLAAQTLATQEAAERVADTILSPGFRKRLLELCNLSVPIVAALRKFDGNVPIAGKAYRTLFDTVQAVRGLELPWVGLYSFG
jgi:hypothetical protein